MYVVRYHSKKHYKGRIVCRTESLSEARDAAAEAMGRINLSKKRLKESYPNGGGYWEYCTPFDKKLYGKAFHTGGVSIVEEVTK